MGEKCVALKFQVVPVTPYEQNCTVLWCDETLKAAVVDPGGDLDRVLAVCKKHGVQVEKILLTHPHIDHAGAAATLAEKLGVPIEGPQKADLFWIQGLPQQSVMMRFPPAKLFTPDRWLEDGDQVSVGNVVFDVIHCPGHTPGHVVFYQPDAKLALVGDVLFNGSIGRTDFPLGNFESLVHSIRQKLFPLGDDIAFIPGHGPMSTFGHERKTNPFVSDRRG
ncbi:Metallo-beta-lactamase family protein [gamma proteobacterium HdN1]|nr:Metallo-beta-lactamase family protein [gamma proteobacterium HdN1]